MGATKLMTAAGGGITLDAASTASDKTITVPARTGNMAVDGPAFSAYASSGLSLSGGTSTKIVFDTEEFDTNSNFASNRFTPTVAGYYQLNANIRPNNTNAEAGIAIYKNGSGYKNGSNVSPSLGSQYGTFVSSLVYANGTTDYFEVYVYVGSSGTASGGIQSTWFNGAMVRAA